MDNELAKQKLINFSSKERAFAWSGIGFVAFISATIEWFSPTKPPFTGKWAWTSKMAYDVFGTHGVAILLMLLGSLLCLSAIWTLWTFDRRPSK